ncbi:hypothetical protein CEUSTIGMA_g2432.t1 [Chlamydomonas eustigma]|uniref:Pherophorin domain-containing protein n=1 Tax=Chlamydomonas eustigma TaxID=1157962 RepID=A0A250WW45_9CHLO|nr:hypothetical protein CEUSTIGMA_g2432.t1 [Chlamydomonas eustigma]|eukprot:GAX74986.1 hypothetical protein CEUSTIGMA_g2432.t1 [Chlamydomonas eustigma]
MAGFLKLSYQRWRRKACALLALLSLPNVFSTFSSYRYLGSQSCTLQANVDNGFCQVQSILGQNSSSRGYNALQMFLGETNCNVTLQQCRVNTCYSFRDLTGQLPSDPTITFTTGFFKSIQIISGATNFHLTREGFYFQATSSDVVLQYSTQICSDFYAVHSGIPQQFCNQPIPAITLVGTDGLTSLSCTAS